MAKLTKFLSNQWLHISTLLLPRFRFSFFFLPHYIRLGIQLNTEKKKKSHVLSLSCFWSWKANFENFTIKQDVLCSFMD